MVGRTSSFSFKGKNEDLRVIGQKLDVAEVLEGSVRTDGSRIRITAQLISVSDGTHLWARTFERERGAIFAVQEEIAQAAVEALKVKLLPGKGPGTREQRTAHPEAYNQYLLGKQFSKLANEEGFRRAVEAYEKALALDPSFAPAWAWLAVDLDNLSIFTSTASSASEAQSRAAAAAERAVALAPDLAESHAALAYTRSSVFDWSGAQAELERALELNPGDASTRLEYAYLLATLGRVREGIVNARKAAEIDPLWSRTWNRLGRFYNATGELDLAESALKRALEISPEYYSGPYHLGTTYLLQRNPAAALAAFERANPEANRLIGVAMARHDLGHRKESQLGLETAAARHSQAWAFQIAEGYAWCGERDRAFDWLERAYLQRDEGMAMLKFTPLLRSLHGDPRYAALLQKLNLPPD